MDWKPRKQVGLIWGVFLLAALLLVCCSLIRSLWGAPVDLTLYLRSLLLLTTVSLLLVVAYGLYALATMAYRVERNGLTIRWGLVQDVIPLRTIIEVVPFPKGLKLAGAGWPGYNIGQSDVEGLGLVRLYATGAPEQGLLIRTRGCSYLLTPADVDGLIADYRARRSLGEIAQWPQEVRVPRLLRLPIVQDRCALLLFSCALVLNIALFGFLAAHYPTVAPRLVLSYDAHGLGSRVGARSELFLLPGMALAMVLVNSILAVWVHRRERMLALLLLGNLSLVQILAWLATSRVIG